MDLPPGVQGRHIEGGDSLDVPRGLFWVSHKLARGMACPS